MNRQKANREGKGKSVGSCRLYGRLKSLLNEKGKSWLGVEQCMGS